MYLGWPSAINNNLLMNFTSFILAQNKTEQWPVAFTTILIAVSSPCSSDGDKNIIYARLCHSITNTGYKHTGNSAISGKGYVIAIGY